MLEDTATFVAPLELSEVVRTFGAERAVDQLDLSLMPGEILGLLGRNGAGKSTTVRLIVGLDRPTSGSVSVFGTSPPDAVRRRLVGYCSQEVAIYPRLSVQDNLLYIGRLAGLTKDAAARSGAALTDELGLVSVAEKAAGHLSGGNKRRLHVALALVVGAPLLVLDEPTAGVDIESRELVIDAVRRRAEAGAAVLYTSHDLHEVERLVDRVAIIDQGKVLVSGSVSDLTESGGDLLRIEFADRTIREDARRSFQALTPRPSGPARLDLHLCHGESAAEVLARCEREGWTTRRVEVVPPSLEAIFLAAMPASSGRGPDDA